MNLRGTQFSHLLRMFFSYSYKGPQTKWPVPYFYLLIWPIEELIHWSIFARLRIRGILLSMLSFIYHLACTTWSCYLFFNAEVLSQTVNNKFKQQLKKILNLKFIIFDIYIITIRQAQAVISMLFGYFKVCISWLDSKASKGLKWYLSEHFKIGISNFVVWLFP